MNYAQRITIRSHPQEIDVVLHILWVLFCVMLCNVLALNAHSAVHAQSDAYGITVAFALPELETATVERDGVVYTAVRYDDSGFTDEVGNPRLPVSRVMLGVPPNVEFRVEVLLATNETQRGYRIPPVPYHVRQRQDNTFGLRVASTEEIQTFAEEWREDGKAYQTGGIYPNDLARISYDGTLRSQRLITLELHPVQYEARTRTLRTHPRMVVRVHFQSPASTFNLQSPSQSSSSFLTPPSSRVDEPGQFEKTFRKLVLNYDEAKRWRVPRGVENHAPMAPAAQHISETRYKILVDKTGIYRLTSEDLEKKWGINLDADPRYLHLRVYGKEIPIYIKGETDGRLDRSDYIEFLGLATDDRYTRRNVYWLSVERSRGVRVSELSASPRDPTAKIVSVFRSRIHFEEDHLTSNLEYAHPDDVSPNDKHGWFEALDFWYWTGIKNSSDFDRVDLSFPLYDLAQSFAQPKIRITLQGGSPSDHEILVSINNVRVADGSVRWERQNAITVEKTLRVWDNLRDATKGETNVLSMARVDTAVEDDTTRYPYHVYINAFDIEYTRLLKAVNDYLEFASPISEESYSIRKRRRLQYTVKHFLSPDIEIFEYDGERLVSKLQNPDVVRVTLEREERERFRAVYRSFVERSNDDDNDEPPQAGEGLPVPYASIPRIAYNATFEAPDTHDSKFIAVSSAGVLSPVRVDVVPPSELLSPSNGADYLIITHPAYLEPAQRLAAWRGTPDGGGYRSKVVDVTQIYDLFNNGMVSPKAIKAFLKHAYEHWRAPALSYVVIMGDGTLDFRGIDKEFYPDPPEVVGYIPTHYIWTSSFGRTAIDHWFATVSGVDELADFYIGRLSVETIDEASAVVDKILNYERTRPNGNWRRQIISVADDEVTNSGDFIFKKSLTEIERSHTLLGYETVRIFLEDIINTVHANPQNYPGKTPPRVAKDMVIDALSQGGVIAQYAGHGGRIVWAHEAIFDTASVDLLDQTNHIPFMMVLSCYNGYFDAASEPSMAEKLLRKERGGIIGMLSATRLTYGSGNDTLNRIIFDDLFKRNVRELGALSFDSKVELLMDDGLGQIDVMMAYTLFGDPAMRLAMADYEMQPRIETKTVAPGGTLKLASGTVSEATYDPKLKQKVFTPLSNFNGKLQVKAVFPGRYETVQGKEGPIEFYTGDVLATQEARVSNGRFPSLSIPVPKGIAAGLGYVEYYAENATHIAVGGDSFTVLVPKIVDIQATLVTDTTFRIRIQVSDELGDKGVKDVLLEWRSPDTAKWHTETLIADREDGWYTVSQPLPVPSNGEAIRYEITVTDIEGRVVDSGTREYRPFRLPDLRVVEHKSRGGDAFIYYRYSPDSGSWTLNVEVEQVEALEFKELREKVGEVEVVFFEGHPDVNEDGVVDTDVKPIGKTTIPIGAWQRRDALEPHRNVTQNSGSSPRTFRESPLNNNWIAVVTIPYQLPLGNHEIFIYVDPIWEKNSTGTVREGDEENNISERRIEVHGTLVGKNDVHVFSTDRVVDFRVPSGAVAQPTVLTVTPLPRVLLIEPQSVRQPSLKPIALPNGVDAVAYYATLGNGLGDPTPTLGNGTVNQPILVEIRFDLGTLRANIRDELFGGTEDDASPLQTLAMTPEQEAAINQGAEARAKEIGVYLFVETLGKWVRLPSELVTASNGLMQIQPALTNMRTLNFGNGDIDNVSITPTNSLEGLAKTGQWILFFTSADTYRVLVRERLPRSSGDELPVPDKGTPLELLDPGRRMTAFTDMPYFKDGVAIDIRPGKKPFQYGDILTFVISESSSPLNTSEGTLPQRFASALREDNNGTGTLQYIHLEPDSTVPPDRWVLLFTDSTHFQIEGKKTGILSQNGEPILGMVGEEFRYTEFGMTLKIIPGRWRFEAGDSFRFETEMVGRIRAQVPMLGPLTLMQSDDTIPPIIQLTVGGQNFVDGDPISKEPFIGATLTDDNGIDSISRPIRLEFSLDGRAFVPVASTEYRLTHRPGANQVVLNYQSAELEPGSYEFRLTVSDIDGNESVEELKARVPEVVQLAKAMNYPNPFQEDTTISCILDGAADELTVKIYSLSGRLIYESKEDAPVGFMMVPWNGRDKDGEKVANGVYYCKIRVKMEGKKDLTEVIRMMKLR